MLVVGTAGATRASSTMERSESLRSGTVVQGPVADVSERASGGVTTATSSRGGAGEKVRGRLNVTGAVGLLVGLLVVV